MDEILAKAKTNNIVNNLLGEDKSNDEKDKPKYKGYKYYK